MDTHHPEQQAHWGRRAAVAAAAGLGLLAMEQGGAGGVEMQPPADQVDYIPADHSDAAPTAEAVQELNPDTVYGAGNYRSTIEVDGVAYKSNPQGDKTLGSLQGTTEYRAGRPLKTGDKITYGVNADGWQSATAKGVTGLSLSIGFGNPGAPNYAPQAQLAVPLTLDQAEDGYAATLVVPGRADVRAVVAEYNLTADPANQIDPATAECKQIDHTGKDAQGKVVVIDAAGEVKCLIEDAPKQDTKETTTTTEGTTSTSEAPTTTAPPAEEEYRGDSSQHVERGRLTQLPDTGDEHDPRKTTGAGAALLVGGAGLLYAGHELSRGGRRQLARVVNAQNRAAGAKPPRHDGRVTR